MSNTFCLLAAFLFFSAPAAMAQFFQNGSFGRSPLATATGTAQMALISLHKSSTPVDLANVLTDDSAGDTANYWATWMAFAYLAANTTVGENAIKSTVRDPGLFVDLTSLLEHYHITIAALMKGSAADAMRQSGREILTNMSPLIARWNAIVPADLPDGTVPAATDPEGPTLPPCDIQAFTHAIPASIGEYNVTFETRQHLILAPKEMDQIGEPASMEAIFDNVQWSVRIADIATVWKSQSPPSATLPPMHGLPSSVLSEDTSAAPLFEAINNLQVGAVKRIVSAHPEWLNSYNRLGETPLSKAVYDRSKPIVAYLLTQHPDLKAVDAVGMTALDKAQYWHLDAIAAMLKAAGAQ